MKTNRLTVENRSARKTRSRPKSLEPLCYYTRQTGLCRSNGKIILDYNLDGSNLITWAPKAERCSRREVEHSLEGDSSCCPWREAHGKQEKECGWPLSEQRSAPGWEPARKRGLRSHNRKELISGNTWMSLEADSSSEHAERNIALLTPWFWPCETLSRRVSQTTMYSDFWSTQLWNNKWALFQVLKCVVIYYGSNKELISSQIWQHKVKQIWQLKVKHRPKCKFRQAIQTEAKCW